MNKTTQTNKLAGKEAETIEKPTCFYLHLKVDAATEITPQTILETVTLTFFVALLKYSFPSKLLMFSFKGHEVGSLRLLFTCI